MVSVDVGGLPQEPDFSGGGGTASDFIGIPKDYAPHTYGGGANPFRQGTKEWYRYSKNNPMGSSGPVNQFGAKPNEPLYKNGDEWAPTKAPEGITLLQSQLVSAGLLNAKDVRPGQWDAKSAAAYRNVLSLANANGGTWQDALQWLVANPTAGQLAGADKPTMALANPEDIKTSYKNAAEQLTGGDLPSSDADKYLQYYKQQEAAQYNVMQQGGGQYTSPMSAESYVRQQDPTQVANYNSASRLIEFYRMLNVI
jgi:hypothetical protein